jgi:hypothetical protein
MYVQVCILCDYDTQSSCVLSLQHAVRTCMHAAVAPVVSDHNTSVSVHDVTCRTDTADAAATVIVNTLSRSYNV